MILMVSLAIFNENVLVNLNQTEHTSFGVISRLRNEVNSFSMFLNNNFDLVLQVSESVILDSVTKYYGNFKMCV